MIARQRFWIGIAALLVIAAALLLAGARQTTQTVFALAPVEIVAEGLGRLHGIVVDPMGTVFVTDVKKGQLLRIAPGGPTGVMLDGLRRPVGLTFDSKGRLVVVESHRRRILRLELGGEVITLSSGIRHAQWIAAAPDGRLYVTAKGLGVRGRDALNEEGEPEMVVTITPEGEVQVFADRFRGLQGLSVDENELTLLARGKKWDRHVVGGLYTVPIEFDGRAGTPDLLVMDQFRRASGLGRDRLGAHFVSAQRLAGEPWHRRVIARVGEDGGTTLFAEGLRDPRGLAFGPDGSLYVADGQSGRVLRFIAPLSPILEALPPTVTSKDWIVLRLRAEPRGLLTVTGGQFPVEGMVDQSGSVVVTVPLHPNAANHLLAFTTANAGIGLSSAPLEVMVIRDDDPPSLELVTPQAGAFVRSRITAEVHAADANGITHVEFRVDDTLVGLDAVEPFRVRVDTTAVPDGQRTFSATVWDRAGNITSVATRITVDNTPPEVKIVAPVSGVLSSDAVDIIAEATDATSGVTRVEVAVNGVLRFATDTPPYRFRLDPEGLESASYIFVATALDQAGNRGESEAVSVTLADVRVQIQEPTEGARVPPGVVLVRGRVEASTAEVGVALNGFPAAVQDGVFAALIPVTPDTASLTAIATTLSGATISHSIAISVSAPLRPPMLLHAAPETGTAPLTVAFSLLRVPRNGVVTLDFDGDGSADFAGASLDGQAFTYSRPGLFFPSATVTDADGGRLTASAVVQVYDRASLDILLQDKWNMMREALRHGDINGALEMIARGSRAEFQADFMALAPFLPTFAKTLEDIQVVAVRGTHIECKLLSVEDGLPFSYYVEFIRDIDGVWRIAFF